jgi:hypothetical protein
MRSVAMGLIASLLAVTAALADELSIAGTVKAIDAPARTILVGSAARGKIRLVTIEIPPGCPIVRFVRSTEPGKGGFAERPAALGDLKPGWVVSVKTRHHGDREVAEAVRVVTER